VDNGCKKELIFIEILPILGGQTEFGYELLDQKLSCFRPISDCTAFARSFVAASWMERLFHWLELTFYLIFCRNVKHLGGILEDPTGSSSHEVGAFRGTDLKVWDSPAEIDEHIRDSVLATYATMSPEARTSLKDAAVYQQMICATQINLFYHQLLSQSTCSVYPSSPTDAQIPEWAINLFEDRSIDTVQFTLVREDDAPCQSGRGPLPEGATLERIRQLRGLSAERATAPPLS
jgi:hypothetical protein